MGLSLRPRTRIGKIAVLLSVVASLMIGVGIAVGVGLPVFLAAALGLAGLALGIGAFVRRDRSLAGGLPLLIGGVITFVLAAQLVNSLGLFKDFAVKTNLTSAEAGSPGSAIFNLGVVSEGGGAVYYEHKGVIYRREADWTGRTRLAEASVSSMCLTEDALYYFDFRRSGVYRVDPDGGAESLVRSGDLYDFTVADDTMLCRLKPSPSKGATGSDQAQQGPLYVVAVDGSGQQLIAYVDLNQPLPLVLDGWVYYCHAGDLFKVMLDGSAVTAVATDAPVEHVAGGWLYYMVRSEEGKGLEGVELWRIRPDGTGRERTVQLTGVYIYTVSGSRLYYTSGRGLLCVNLDGTGATRLNNTNIWGLAGVSDGWFYIEDYGGPRFRVRMDGSVGTRLD